MAWFFFFRGDLRHLQLKAGIDSSKQIIQLMRPPSRVEEGCAHYLPHWHVEARPSSAFGCNQWPIPTVLNKGMMMTTMMVMVMTMIYVALLSSFFRGEGSLDVSWSFDTDVLCIAMCHFAKYIPNQVMSRICRWMDDWALNKGDFTLA